MKKNGSSSIGDDLRAWRERRHLSQLELSLRAEVSARHLSFVETGRAGPGRELILRLAEELEIPLRERNTLLVTSGRRYSNSGASTIRLSTRYEPSWTRPWRSRSRSPPT
jgi:transcriptional regulator with XRE-family HTH domain